MTTADISSHFEKARSELKREHDSMVQSIKEAVNASQKKTLAKV